MKTLPLLLARLKALVKRDRKFVMNFTMPLRRLER
jgi:hypothetical protein